MRYLYRSYCLKEGGIWSGQLRARRWKTKTAESREEQKKKKESEKSREPDRKKAEGAMSQEV